MAKSDIELAYAALAAKLPTYDKLFAYVSGNQPLVYSTHRLQEAFRSLTAHFQQDWCSVVVNAALDRMTLSGFDADSDALNDTLKTCWNENGMGIESTQVHEMALITGEAFVIAWEGENGIEVFANDPRLCHVFYESANRHKKRFAAKWFKDEAAACWRLTLYYPDRQEYYRTQETTGDPSSAMQFEPDVELPTAPNPYGIIPVFHFRGNPRSGQGELSDILSLQDAVNKLLADMMVSAEYGAFKQRYIISNSDTADLKNAPNLIWNIPAGDGQGQPVQVGEFQGTDLNLYLNAIDKLANSIAIISRTPKHYLFGTGGSLSGEALLAMEAPLNKKVAKLEDNYGAVWQEVASFLLLLSGKGEVSPSSIKPIWQPPESVQPLTEAQARKTAVEAGVPLVTELKREGWTDDEIAAMQKDAEEAKKGTATTATALLDTLRIRDAQANPAGQPQPGVTPPALAPFAAATARAAK